MTILMGIAYRTLDAAAEAAAALWLSSPDQLDPGDKPLALARECQRDLGTPEGVRRAAWIRALNAAFERRLAEQPFKLRLAELKTRRR